MYPSNAVQLVGQTVASGDSIVALINRKGSNYTPKITDTTRPANGFSTRRHQFHRHLEAQQLINRQRFICQRLRAFHRQFPIAKCREVKRAGVRGKLSLP